MSNTSIIAAGVFALAFTALFAYSVVPSLLPGAIEHPLMRLFDGYSLNWAGYYVNSSTYTFASANWTVPSVSTSVSGDSSAWVGIGGVYGNGLIQTGTSQDCSGGRKGCTASYYAWWETYPLNAEQKINSSISPGDAMYAYVVQDSPGAWTISLRDISKNWVFTKNVSFSPDQASAEAVMERPASCLVKCTLTNLADFGKAYFTQAEATGATGNVLYYNLLKSTQITMLDSSGRVLAATGSLLPQGTFNVTWKRSS